MLYVIYVTAFPTATKERFLMTKQNLIERPCHNCSFSGICLPLGLNEMELKQLEQLVQKHREIKCHEHLFHAGEPFKRLYAVRYGTFKSYTINTEGDEQISGFNLPAELVGIDGIHSGKHCISILALETSSVCELPFNQLLILAGKIPALQQHLFQIMSQCYTSQLHVSINSNAEMRFASFLLDISRRLQERGLSPRDFALSMSRHDIGNYLGLAAETVSRLFHSFEEKKILTVQCRRIHLNDLRALQTLACM